MHRPRHRASPIHEPRIEMAPLLDIIFLLLTFFIYTMVVTIRAEVIPITLPGLTTGQTPAQTAHTDITVDRQGRFYWNREPVMRSALAGRLAAVAAQPDPPQIFLAIDAREGDLDRAPILLDMLKLFHELQIKSFHIVGRPGESPAARD